MNAALLPVDDEVRLPEVDLGLSRGPNELQILVFGRSSLLVPPLHVELDCGVAHFCAVLLYEPLMDALRVVLLFVPAPVALVEICLDDFLVGVKDRRLLPPHWNRRGETTHGEVLSDRRDGHLLVRRDLR